MPSNMFMGPDQGHQAINRGLGFNVNNAIQGFGGQIMQGAQEEQRMGRKKWANDMLAQELANAHAQLQTSKAGYDFGQQQHHDQWQQGPQGQAAMQAYRARLGLPDVPQANTAAGVIDELGMQKEALGQQQHQQAVAAQLLALHTDQPGVQPPPEIMWARSVLGPQGAQPAPELASHQEATPPAPAHSPRGAMGVFAHEALPAAAGVGLGAAVASKVPGAWKIPAFAGGALVGDRVSRMIDSPSTPEELAAHPWASTLGSLTGSAGAAMAGATRFMPGAVQSPASNLASGMGTRVKNMFSGNGAQTTPSAPPVTPTPAGNFASRPQGAPFNPAQGVSESVPQPGSNMSLGPDAAIQKAVALFGEKNASANLAKPVGKRGRSMPGTGPGSGPLASPVGSRGRTMPTGPAKASSMSQITPPGARGRGLTPASSVDPKATIAEFFRLNGRMPTMVELQQAMGSTP